MNARLRSSLLPSLSVALLLVTMGAAFGSLSGLGPVTGILSTCLIALITSLIGGTRYGISSLTGPMTAAAAVVIASEANWVDLSDIALSQMELLRLTLFMSGVLILILALLQIHKLVKWVPNLVISGFVNGIAVLIVMSQARGLDLSADWILAALSFFASFVLSSRLIRSEHPIWKLLASSFVVIVLFSGVAALFKLPVTYFDFQAAFNLEILNFGLPKTPALSTVSKLLPTAFELAMIAILDTLLTSMILQKESKIKAPFVRELSGQSLSMLAISSIAGVPGAQSTVPSMMLLKEGGHHPWSKALVALFTILISVFFVGLIQYVPVAVLAGIIFKVAYDVADFSSLKTLVKERSVLRSFILLGTFLSTVFLSLNLAVIGFTTFFVLWNQIMPSRLRVSDMRFETESEGLVDEL